jgi:hypothetical protein
MKGYHGGFNIGGRDPAASKRMEQWIGLEPTERISRFPLFTIFVVQPLKDISVQKALSLQT